ncbi:MAG: hypothetical protein J6O40_02035 [Ruminococcus sp.]|nr:hypothetical protein [Ruminococcus sp.]
MRRVTSPKRLDLFIFLMIAALMGVLFGTLIYCYVSGDMLSSFLMIRDSLIEERLSLDFGAALIKSFMTGLLFMAVIYLLGLCALGQPFTVLVLFYKAVGIGAAAASVFSSYGKDGIVMFAFLLLPEGAAALLILILAARESITMSGIVFKTLLSDSNDRHLADITKLYSVKLLILLSITGAASLLQSVMSCVYKILQT